MRKLLTLVFVITVMGVGYSQTPEEAAAAARAEADVAAKTAADLDAAAKALEDALPKPKWTKGAFGTIGGNLSGFNNWYAKGAPNSAAGNIGFTVNAFANLKEEKYFWRNGLNVNLGWVKLDDKDDPTDAKDFQAATDVFNITSLYGRNISDKFAISTLGEYRTTIIDNFNDPGYLDIGVGATWTPLANLVVVIHPLNYNFVFSKGESVYESSTGAKIVADYNTKFDAINFKSNFSTFQSYSNGDLSNWTWVNSFGYTLWKKIGVGFEFGLRSNKQEALSYGIGITPEGGTPPTFETVDNDLQSYWLFGLNYSF